MGKEIEHKFLVKSDDWKTTSTKGVLYSQGYISFNPAVRVRIAGEIGYLTLKSKMTGITRQEFEYEIPVDNAKEMLATLTKGDIIEKKRYLCVVAGKTWEIDVFSGKNEGLVVAEIELESEDEPFEIPAWVGECVTHDRRYLNSSLSQNPFYNWDEK